MLPAMTRLFWHQCFAYAHPKGWVYCPCCHSPLLSMTYNGVLLSYIRPIPRHPFHCIDGLVKLENGSTDFLFLFSYADVFIDSIWVEVRCDAVVHRFPFLKIIAYLVRKVQLNLCSAVCLTCHRVFWSIFCLSKLVCIHSKLVCIFICQIQDVISITCHFVFQCFFFILDVVVVPKPEMWGSYPLSL